MEWWRLRYTHFQPWHYIEVSGQPFCLGTLQPLPITQQVGATDYLDLVKMEEKKIIWLEPQKTLVSMFKDIAS